MTCHGMTAIAPTFARCRECNALFEVPAIGQCPHCDSRQIRRVDPTENALRDALAELDNLAAQWGAMGVRLTKTRDTVAKMLDRIVAS